MLLCLRKTGIRDIKKITENLQPSLIRVHLRNVNYSINLYILKILISTHRTYVEAKETFKEGIVS